MLETEYFTGALLLKSGHCLFKVWAPGRKSMALHFPEENATHTMSKSEDGYFSIMVEDIHPGQKYFFRPDDQKYFPDPSSFFQPDGVHGPSAVVDHNTFRWTDGEWKGLPFSELIIYELHVGTFTNAGTFDAAADHLDHLREIGINAIELMPVAQFPGDRNWGYDGVFPYAVQNSYGGPDGLKRFVDACHSKGIAVFLDVVYNHVGPEGNYFAHFGPYFTSHYHTPWADAINFDGEWSDGVREFFCNNALYWLREYHLDGLRLDAIHMVFDNGAVHFWQMLNERILKFEKYTGRKLHLIAESDLNSPKVIQPTSAGGFGFRAQWLDDFHHALYVLLDPQGHERYYDFGSIEQLAKAYKDGFVHSGEYVKFRKRKHGTSSAGINGDRFVVFNQNHDQIGNRPQGERLSMLVDEKRLKVAAAALFVSPYVPMLFMGEEWAAQSPFFYFVSHSDEALIEAVRKGRHEEFKAYGKFEPPDAQAEQTFAASKLDWATRNEKHSQVILEWHKAMIQFRRQSSALQNFSKDDISVICVDQSGLLIERKDERKTEDLCIVMNFQEKPFQFVMPASNLRWQCVLDSNDPRFSSITVRPVGNSTIDPGKKAEIDGCSVVIYRVIA